ncbi:MAG: ATP-binding protein [Microbacteriaceae bacterium]
MRKLFVASLLGLSASVAIGQGLITYDYVVKTEQRKVITEFERDAFVLGGRAEDLLSDPAPLDATRTTLTNLITKYAESRDTEVIVTDSKGIAVLTSNPTKLEVGEDFTNRPEIGAALTGNVSSGERWSNTLQSNLVYVAVPVINGSNIYGTVRLSFPHGEIDAAVTNQTQFLWWVAGAAVTLSLLVSWILSGVVIRPLKRIEGQTNALAAGDFSARLPEVHGTTEIATLTNAFNTMADKLESLIRQQRAFASDASHQLRTPLTALLLRLERAREALPKTSGVARERIADAEAEVGRLNDIVEGLLAIARAEGGAATLATIDVGVIAQDRVESWRALAEERGITMAFDGDNSALVRAIPSAPEQIIDNYIDNAIAHSPAGTAVLVRVRRVQGSVTVDVIDSGSGLTSEQCERAFDRFWRADSTSEGTGLGLAIVKHLAELGGATVGLAPRSRDGGVVASVTFPAA